MPAFRRFGALAAVLGGRYLRQAEPSIIRHEVTTAAVVQLGKGRSGLTIRCLDNL